MKTGYSIRTWRMRLFCSEKQMIEATEDLYREAVNFYYELLKDREDLWEENLLAIQGQLEKLTVPGKDGRVPRYIPPGGKLPVYFRRSAMNKAAMAVKTAAGAESFPEKIDANITFFKGMYRDLTDTSVVLKLWNGKKWIWTECSLTGRPFPKEAAILSPTLVHEEKWLMFHVPVKQENSDANDPHSLIAASDVFVLPNHETYFDLILLEVLSLGVPVVMSRTGGNKYFEQFKQPGLKFYDTLEEAQDRILDIKKMPVDELCDAKAGIIEMFNNEFTVEKFAKNYINIISEIAASIR